MSLLKVNNDIPTYIHITVKFWWNWVQVPNYKEPGDSSTYEPSVFPNKNTSSRKGTLTLRSSRVEFHTSRQSVFKKILFYSNAIYKMSLLNYTPLASLSITFSFFVFFLYLNSISIIVTLPTLVSYLCLKSLLSGVS